MTPPKPDGSQSADLQWPSWPQSSPDIEDAAVRVLRSARWAISGMNRGGLSEERAFGDEFARFVHAKYGVPVANGSSALVTALEAAGVGFGDEVLVPGLVWIACASAVARVGAIPVLVDVSEDTFCMSALAAASAITERTRAILLVHLYSSIADLDAFTKLAADHDLALIEDCSQAHGASWRGRRVGSFGIAGTFSFQNLKLLTCGEGGIVVTSSDQIFDAAQQFRADGRRWLADSVPLGSPDLEEIGSYQGHNFCMPEISAAILRASLPRLEDQNRLRAQNVAIFEDALASVKGAAVVRAHDDRITEPTFYHVPVQIDPEMFAGASGEAVGAAVTKRVGLYLEPVDPPLNKHPLYRPNLYRRFDERHRAQLGVDRFDLPVATHLSRTSFTIPHYAFLGTEDNLFRLVEAVMQVQKHQAS
jgi:dTDP-4-amino-4,6-dideoxygalactose transaminase